MGGSHGDDVRVEVRTLSNSTDPSDSIMKRPLSSATKLAIKNATVIMNPFSGNGRARNIYETVRPILESDGITITLLETQYCRHAWELAGAITAQTCQAIIVIGGDGTLSEVLNGMVKGNVNLPVGLIPGGTGNSVARSLGISNPEVATRSIIEGRLCPIDLAKCTYAVEAKPFEHYFVNLAGFGLGVDANVTAASLRCLGTLRYDVGALWQIMTGKVRQTTVTIDGDVVTGDLSIIMVQNNKHGGDALRLAPSALLDDGLLDIVLLPNVGRCGLLKLFSKLKDGGKHVTDPRVDYRRFRRIRIETAKPELINIDGENVGQTPVDVEIAPRAFQLFVSATPHLC